MNDYSRQLRLFAGIILIAASSALVAEENPATYSTSFESMPVGQLDEARDGAVTWKAHGESFISSQYYNTGSKGLHLSGGTKNTIELSLEGELRQSRGIRFQAERWTTVSPFEFRIQALINGAWEEVSNLDTLVLTGRSFLNDVIVKLPDTEISALRLVCTAPAGKGVLIDDFELLKNEPTNVSKGPEVATEVIRQIRYDEALFISGTQDTHTFRIPAIITAMNGDLIAACDARRNNGADLITAQDVDIVIRRSSDNGKTWTQMEIVCDLGDGYPASDPSLILDQTSGEIFCFYNYMDQKKAHGEFRLWVQSSMDHGKTWGEPRDITDEMTLPEWKMDFKFITSGRGIQTRSGELLHTLVRPGRGVHVFGSKDHGESWYLMTKEPLKPADESKVIELVDERLMVNCRVNGHGYRWVHTSDASRNSWEGRNETSLVDPGCNGSILRYTSVKDGYAKNRLLFCNANSFNGRKNLSVRISYDEGETWNAGKVIDTGESAYSSLTICEDGSIGVLYEPGYKLVRFANFTLEDLTDGEDQLSKPYRLPGLAQ